MEAFVVKVNCTDVTAQVKVPDTVASVVGCVVFAETVAEAVLVQPSSGLVTVSVYTPDWLTKGFCWNWFWGVIPGPDQENVAPGVVELPIRVASGLAQVMVPPVAVALGGFVLQVTDVASVAVQPLVVLVTKRL